MPDNLKKNSENEDDVRIENEDLDDSVMAEEGQSQTIMKLRKQLKEAESKRKEYLDNWQRAQAEFVNLRKKDEEAKQEFLRFATAAILENLLPVLDSLDLAVKHGNKDAESIYNQFLSILKQNGLEESNPVGEIFDPRLHEAVASLPVSDNSEDQKILEVVQKGYILGGKIIRPAKVRIGEFTN